MCELFHFCRARAMQLQQFLQLSYLFGLSGRVVAFTMPFNLLIAQVKAIKFLLTVSFFSDIEKMNLVNQYVRKTFPCRLVTEAYTFSKSRNKFCN